MFQLDGSLSNKCFEVVYGKEYPTKAAFHAFLQSYLEEHNLAQCRDAQSVIDESYELYEKFDESFDASAKVIEIQLPLLKTCCIEVVKRYKQARNENRKQFDEDVQSLFDSDRSEAISFCASIARTLRQYRLKGTYAEREIIAEAYARGVKKIEKGEIINTPLAWLRRTCLNIIREFSREQERADRPKRDAEPWTLGGVALAQMLQREDWYAIYLAFADLSLEDQEILLARIVDGHSWQVVNERLADRSSVPLKLGSVRQRGARALTRLRDRYNHLRDTVQLPNPDKDA